MAKSLVALLIAVVPVAGCVRTEPLVPLQIATHLDCRTGPNDCGYLDNGNDH